MEVDDRAACTVVAASGGYPGDYKKGIEINGLDEASKGESFIFHAGTTAKDGKVLTNGGRVLCVTSFGSEISYAALKSVKTLSKISFDGMFFRSDIGYEFE